MFILLMAVVCPALVSCSDDDDDNDTSTPAAFESYAAKYEVMGVESAEWASVEFTESGNYILTRSPYVNAVPKRAASEKAEGKAFAGKLLSAKAARVGEAWSPILYGKYTVDADGTYNLAGYGKVKVTQDAGGSNFSLEFIPDMGTSHTYKATKQNRNLNSANSSRLCRTWNIDKFQVIFKLNGKTMLDLSASSVLELAKKYENWVKQHDDEYDPDDSEWDYSDLVEPKQVIFTKTGTYMVKYEGDQLAVSTWRWTNGAETELQYAWDNDFDDDFLSGVAGVDYKKGQLVITEKDSEREDGDLYETINVTYLNEAK